MSIHQTMQLLEHNLYVQMKHNHPDWNNRFVIFCNKRSELYHYILVFDCL